MSANEWWRCDATELARRVRQGEVTADELAAAARARIAALNPTLNAVVSLAADDPPTLDGPFGGVPFLAKDVLAVPGMPATMGSRLFAGNVPGAHVPYTSRLAESGLRCLGKTATSELGLLGSTETALAGVTRNPWGAEWSAAGSSGGSAAAVAAGLVPIAHANDGGGSIRLPAALAGLFGFKPSAGASAPASAVDNDFLRLVSEGCVSRSVRDTDAYLAATAAEPRSSVGPGRLGPLRIGVYTSSALGEEASPEGRAAVEEAAALCASLGHRVEWVEAPRIRGETAANAFFVVAGSSVRGLMELMTPMLGRPPGPAELEPFTLALVAWAWELGPEALGEARRALDVQGADLRAFLDGVDVALCPTWGGPRPALGLLAPHLPLDVLMARTRSLAGFTAGHNPAGAPSMSVPMGWTPDGLPVGCQLAAAPGRDTMLMRLAYQLEEAAPWAHRWPPDQFGENTNG
ncbi:MAG: amidase [Alphaproteobacteria bacterium]|nr:amidase [Alphaproteobacteria bacterium]MCB9697299.1 amidase [Alphaproteobacteria bacterium]